MKKLITITNKDIIKDLRDIKDLTLLYPLKSFCVGYDEYFEIEEIDDFVLVNRLLNDEELDLLESILKKGSIKGIIFDDLGIIEAVKNLNITKILLLDHLATNSKSINYYLEYVDSVVISSDLTEDEIKYIAQNSKKPLVLSVFDLKKLMYSRRTLLKNYAEYHQITPKSTISSTILDKDFIIKENEYGTCFYIKDYYNALKLLDMTNILYFWYNPIGLDKKNILNLVQNKTLNIPSNQGFLNQATIYKIKEEKNV